MSDPRAHRVLASVTRVAVLEVLRQAGRPLGVLELADKMGLHANTIRSTSTCCSSTGTLPSSGTSRDDRAGRGRSTPSPTRPTRSDPQQRNYRLLASVLASYLSEADDPQAAALEAGRRFGAELRRAAGARREQAGHPRQRWTASSACSTPSGSNQN